jgi:hypothetical protein
VKAQHWVQAKAPSDLRLSRTNDEYRLLLVVPNLNDLERVVTGAHDPVAGLPIRDA